MDQANEFLKKEFVPKFNQKFSVVPRLKVNLHKKLSQPEQKQLPAIFSKQTKRIIQNDFTFSFKNQWRQLTKEQPATVCKKDQVIIEERLSGDVAIRLRNKYLNYQLLPQRPVKATKPIWVLAATKPTTEDDQIKERKPAFNHPWRLTFHAAAQANLQRAMLPR